MGAMEAVGAIGYRVIEGTERYREGKNMFPPRTPFITHRYPPPPFLHHQEVLPQKKCREKSVTPYYTTIYLSYSPSFLPPLPPFRKERNEKEDPSEGGACFSPRPPRGPSCTRN